MLAARLPDEPEVFGLLALMELQASRLGARTGWFGLAVRDDAFLRAASLNLSGYPGDKEAAREVIHGIPSAEWKATRQSPATEEQLARMAASVAKNAQE